MNDFHTVVIGSGSGGLTVAVGLTKLGKRVALIEARAVGGDCTNVGCVPSKTLIHLAGAPDGRSAAAILARVQEKRNALRDEETAEVKEMKNLTFIEGRARFLGAERLEVALSAGGTRELTAKNIVIATGSKPRRLELPGLPETRTLTNESLFELADKPEHLVIIGGGVVGSEMAFAFRKLGSRVSLVNRSDRVLSASEPEASEVVGEAMTEAGIDLYLGAQPATYDEPTRTLWIEQGRRVALPGVDKVLLAVGRLPGTEGLGLEAAGVSYDETGIPADAYGKTNVKGIYAIGDVNPASSYTHSANAQGRRVVQHVAFPFLPTWGRAPSYPNATFTTPEVAEIGLTLAKLRERYHPALLKTVSFDLTKTDKGYTEDLGRGFVQIHALRLTGRIVGATIVAPKASEMISLLTAAVADGLTLYKLSGLVFPYPVLSEGIKKVADAFVFETLPKLPRELGAYLRYRWAGPQTDKKQPRQQSLPTD